MNSVLVKDSGLPEGAAVFFDECARHILAQHTNEIPDLRRIVVLLPNYHVAQPLAQALAGAAQRPALLLPTMVTLNDWAQSVPLARSVIPDTCRATTLYQALRARRWFADADLWGIVRELLALLDDLTQHHVTLPQSEEDFLAQLEQAYQARRGSAMQFEARVVHELWYAMNSSGELDAPQAYQQRLAQLAQQATAPLYVLLASELAVPETRFLEAYAEHAPVTCFDLREMSAQQSHCAVAQAALRAPSLNLRDQAAHLREHFPHAALTHPSTSSGRTGRKLNLFAAHGLEHEARAAEVQVRRWLLAGRKNIAIVAQDRLVARRVRALLERSGVLVKDETGWTFSTLAVSTVLMRWLDALQSDFYHHDLLDLLKSPFIFADQAACVVGASAPYNHGVPLAGDSGERKQSVYQLEQLVRKHGVAAHLDAFLDLAHDEPGVQIPLVRLRQAAEPLRRKSHTLAGWLGALDDSLTILGVNQGLAADAAGMQLLQALQTWRTELEGDATRFSLAEWRHWLAQQLDAHTFRDMGIDSTVLLTHLAATRWRGFDAVLLLGCDAVHLPGTDNSGLWFNDAVRATLGLPVSGTRMVQQRDDLLALLAMNNTVLATWQASKNGETNLLSPYLEMLRALHEQAYSDDLAERELGELLDDAQMRSADFSLPDAASMPAPAVPRSLIPSRISASGYNSLMACPYQYYARHLLRLNELDEVREGVEKRDYGEWVHAILHRFHQQFPVLVEHGRAVLEEALLRISSEVFSPAVERDYLARAWLLRWQQAIPVYLDAQLKSEAEGWHYQSGEVPFELPLADDLLLHGRIDRVDDREGECRVLDYKMMDAARLRNKLKEAGEDVQLACYAHVYEADEAAFISIEKDKVINVAPPQDLPELAQANIARLLEVFAQMRAGAAMPAHGVEEACRICEMRGLCRKSEWK